MSGGWRIGTSSVAAVLLCIASPVIGADAKDDKVDKDKELLQGTWQPVKGVMNGEQGPKEILEKLRFIVIGDQMTFKSPAETNSAKFTLDMTKRPRHLDAEILDGSRKGKKQSFIYEVSKDQLKLCYRVKGERPKKLESNKGDFSIYLELKRVKK